MRKNGCTSSISRLIPSLVFVLGLAAGGPAKASYQDDLAEAAEYLEAGKRTYERKDYLTASTLFREAIDLNPDLWEAYYFRGMCHYIRGETDDAIFLFEQAKELHPEIGEQIEDTLARIKVESLGKTYHKPGSGAKQAFENFEKAKEAWDAGRKEEAEGLLGQAFKYDANTAEVHFAIGYIYAQKGNLEGAEQYYQQAVALKPDYVEALNNLGLVYLKKGYLDRAVYQFRKVIQQDYKRMDAYLNLAEALALKGDYKAATDELVKVVAEDDSDIVAYNNLGVYYEESGNITDAIKSWHRVAELGTDTELVMQAEEHLKKMEIYED